MEWVVGLAGVLVAGAIVVFTWYTHRPRSVYQERVYDRQLDAYGEIVRNLIELHDVTQRVLRRSDGKRFERADLREQTTPQAAALFSAYKNQGVFLASRINEQLVQYMQTFSSLDNSDDPAEELDRAFGRVAEAARDLLGVELLSAETSALFGDAASSAPRGMPGAHDAVSLLAHSAFWDDFTPENKTGLRSGAIAADDSDLIELRKRAHADDRRNLFLVHTWRPSETKGQVADIAIQLIEHPREGSGLNSLQPLRDRLVERVEYNLGQAWFDGQSIVKTNAGEDFRLDISAYGPTLCIARVHFTDGKSAPLERYLDFADVRPAEIR